MKDADRLGKVYALICAAHVLLNKGQMMQAVRFLQTARIVAGRTDEFLKRNKAEIDRDCEEAEKVIQRDEEGN